MQDDDFAFDDWQEAANQLEKKKQEIKDKKEQKQEIKQIVQIKSQQKTVVQPQIIKSQQQQEKLTLKSKIKQYKTLSHQHFAQKYKNIDQSNKLILNNPPPPLILKSQKDFNQYAQIISQRIGDQFKKDQDLNNDSLILTFVEQLFMFIYDGLQFKNFAEIQKKIGIIKNQRKTLEKQKEKQKKKQQLTKKNQEQINIKIKANQKKQNDELFQGAGLNSKEQEDQRKNKLLLEKKTQPVKPIADDDDDDFM